MGDVDGDGRLDVAVAAPGEKTGAGAASGAVRLLRGTASGLTGSSTLWGSIVGNRGSFGRAVALADTDRDGHADLVAGGLGVPGGALTVALGRADGLTGPRRHITQDTARVPGADEPGDAFGAALAAGDVDADGYADVVVGAPGEDQGSTADAGAAFVLYGSAGGPGATRVVARRQGADRVPGAPGAKDAFGAAVAVSDLDGDGFGDVVVGSPGEGSGTGAVDVLPGSESGLDAVAATHRTASSLGLGGATGDRFGAALAP
ncbi:hypothetical protein GCM10028814_13810 [Angustibacter aerolatus]